MGFNMSWIFVDQIDLNELYAALDVKSTGEAADPYDLGTGRAPLAGLKPKEGWCAIFGHYSFILDITIGTDPPRLTRLPAKSRAVSCVVLEHAMISYASLWQDGRHIWEVRHQPSKEQPEHLEFWGDLPPEFIGIWGAALQKQRESDARRKPTEWGVMDLAHLPVDYLFDVPLDAAAVITEFRHDRSKSAYRKEAAYREVTKLEPINGNLLRRLSNPPKWWQTVGSIEYYGEGDQSDQSLDRRAYKGNLECEQTPVVGRSRLPIAIIVHNGSVTASFDTYDIDGLHLMPAIAAGTVDSAGMLHFGLTLFTPDAQLRANYTLTLSAAGGTLTGTQVWTRATGGESVTRTCTGTVFEVGLPKQ